MSKCLVCFYDIEEGGDYHKHCCSKLFDSKEPLVLEFGLGDLKNLAIKAVSTQSNITGVQAKISLSPVLSDQGIGKLAVDYLGKFILKPPSEKYPGMPEVEALTMQMAKEFNIGVVPHGLIKMKDGALAYITRRVDRFGGKKTKGHQEDLCQLSERLTEDKYKSSCERVGKIIKHYAGFPKLAAIDYFKLVVFNFIHGNSDMHMKNYSMTHSETGMYLTLAYDLLNSRLLIPDDKEESALTINGKKSNLKKRDFDALAENLELNTEQRDNVYKQLFRVRKSFNETIENSFLAEELKDGYLKIMNTNYKIMETI